MTEDKAVESAPVADGKTSDQILEEIEAAQRELESKGSAKSDGGEPEGASGDDQVKSIAADTPSEQKEISKSSVEVPTQEGKIAVDYADEWMQKRGIKDHNSLVTFLRAKDREFHRQRNEAKKREELPPQIQRAPIPEYRPVPPNAGINQLAEAYQMTPEDLQRLAPLVNDMAEHKFQMRVKPLEEQFFSFQREYKRDQSFKKLERDPLFQNRDVQKEMGLIAEEDPSILEQPDYPEKLFDGALARIGRRLAEGSIQRESAPKSDRLVVPETPPPSGRGSAGGPKGIPLKPPSSISGKDFRRLSVAEMEKELKRMGALRPEGD